VYISFVMIKTSQIVVIIGLLIFVACVPDAPHDNPLDPFYQTSKGINVFSGQVLQKNEPHAPIGDCLVSLLPEQQFVRTDNNGKFSFAGTQPGRHRIAVSKTGYDSLLKTIDFDTVRNRIVHFYLNGTPFLKKIKIYSEYIDQWWPDPVTSMIVEITIGDPDGVSDIRDIRLSVPSQDTSFAFSKTARPDSFFLRLDELVVTRQDLFALVGAQQYVILTDESGTEVTSGPHYLIRIITSTPQTESPTGLQVVDAQPVFTWQPYIAQFSYKYEILIFFLNAGIPILIHRSAELEPQQLQYTYPDSLSPGTYFWTVAIRDRLGNFCRSKEATFIVP